MNLILNILNKYKLIILNLLIIGILIFTVTILVKRLIIADKQNIVNNENIQSLLDSIKITYDEYGRTITDLKVLTVNYTTLANSSDAKIQKLLKTTKDQDIKLKNINYLLSIESGLQIDTTVITRVDTVSELIIQRLDSLEIGSFKLRRIQLNDFNPKYKISYTPTLTATIYDYKIGHWKLKNLFIKRPIGYKLNIVASDSLLKPTDVKIFKLK